MTRNRRRARRSTRRRADSDTAGGDVGSTHRSDTGCRRHPTGITPLDRALGGGLPAGRLIVVTADPASQSELLVNALTGETDTLYLTTVRPAASVERGVDACADGSSLPARQCRRTTVESVMDGDPITAVTDRLASVPARGSVVVDSAGPLEAAAPDRYRSLLTALASTVADNEAVCVVHALETGGPRPRGRVLTEQMADIVFSLETTVTDTAVRNRLSVSKFRGGAALDAPLTLRLTDRVGIDTSRDIG